MTEVELGHVMRMLFNGMKHDRHTKSSSSSSQAVAKDYRKITFSKRVAKRITSWALTRTLDMTQMTDDSPVVAKSLHRSAESLLGASQEYEN